MTEQAPPYRSEPRESPVSIRPSEALAAALNQRRGSAGQAAKCALERYFRVLEDELRRLTLTIPEASLLCDALNGICCLDVDAYRFVWAEVADAIRLQHLDQKWKVADADALVTRLRDLSPGATMALLDAVERFWQRPNAGELAAILRDVGLVRR